MENCRLEIQSRRCAFGLLESWNQHCRLVNLANRSKSVTHQAGDCWALENSLKLVVRESVSERDSYSKVCPGKISFPKRYSEKWKTVGWRLRVVDVPLGY
jgi:hypothetical protein